MKTQPYYCFSEQGEVLLPQNNELEETILKGIEPVLFLDSSVCLHIVKVMDYGRKATQIDLQKLIALKTYIATTPNLSVNPFFGLIELCTRNGALDVRKLWDIKGRIDCFQLLPVKIFKSFSFDFHRDFTFAKDLNMDLPNIYEAVSPSLLNSYCALLKLRHLAKTNGLTQSSAEKSIRQFFDWMMNKLDIIRGIEYQLSLHIFGGHTRYRKMIGLDSKPADVRKHLLGTAWDIFHAKTSSNSFRLFQILGRNLEPYFLTSDANLFGLLKQMNLRLIKDGGEEFTTSFIQNAGFDYPHLKDRFVDNQNQYMVEKFIERAHHHYECDAEKVNGLIIELEVFNGL